MKLINQLKDFDINPVFVLLSVWFVVSIVMPAYASAEEESFVFVGPAEESTTNLELEQESPIELGPDEESVVESDAGGNSTADGNPKSVIPGGKMVIANRADGTISVINVSTDEVVATVSLSDPIEYDETLPEPMYVVYSPIKKRVFVGDRAYHRVVVFSADDFSEEASVEVGAGVFHMWLGPQNQQLWVVGDIRNTATVIDPLTLDVITTVDMPADLVDEELGGKPHDIVLDRDFAYISILGLKDSDDVVVKFERTSFTEVGRRTIGMGTHLVPSLKDRLLYVASQNDGKIFVLDVDTLGDVQSVDVPGAHGVAMSADENTFYTADITTADGTDALLTIDTDTISLLDTFDTFDTTDSVPHNIALTPENNKLYITHSGATADKVSVYSLVRGIPVAIITTIDVGLNPFGLAYVP